MILVDVLLFKDPGGRKVPDSPDPQHWTANYILFLLFFLELSKDTIMTNKVAVMKTRYGLSEPLLLKYSSVLSIPRYFVDWFERIMESI